jgi:hypothetical protein
MRMLSEVTTRGLARRLGCFLAAGLLLSAALPAREKPARQSARSARQRFVTERSGSLLTHRNLRLKLLTDLGSVRIHTLDTARVSYTVRVETDSDSSEAKKLREQFVVTANHGPAGATLRGRAPQREMEGLLWVTFDVSVPSNYSLDVATGAGNIQCDDIAGRANLATQGGNITLGNVLGSAHLETMGGHIVVHDVSGDLSASTGAGHVTAGHIGGTATLHTGGGHIRVSSVGRAGKFDTGGGNISLSEAGAELTATTAGGTIEVGEASGSIRARTGGGGIRVAKIAGPTQLDTGSGSIYLTQVLSPVHASTGTGTITAWINPGAKLSQLTELDSGDGDIVVYLPKQFEIAIDAQIARGDEHHFIADPAFPLKVNYTLSESGGRTLLAAGSLNGGSKILRLRTVAGNIRLIVSDTCLQLQKQVYQQQMEKLRTQLRMHLAPPPPPLPEPPPSQPPLEQPPPRRPGE